MRIAGILAFLLIAFVIVSCEKTLLVNEQNVVTPNDWRTEWRQSIGSSTNAVNNQVTPKPAMSPSPFPTLPTIIAAIAISLCSATFITLRKFKKIIEATF